MSTLLSRVVADFETSLSGAVSVGDSSFTIQSVTDDDSVTLSDGIYCFTLDRDNSSAKEYIVGQLTNATKTVSSISSVSRQGALTSNFQKAHRIGTNVIISDHSALNAIVKILNGTGTLDSGSPIGYDSTATISGANMLATKAYVDSVVNGGTVTYDKQILSSQTAGETLAAGNVVYLKVADSRWWKADADDSTTYDGVKLGIALGAGTAGNTISGGVQVSGVCDSFTGLTANTQYYLSSTAGGVSTSAGTPKISIGLATSTTSITLDFKGYAIPTGAQKDVLTLLSTDGYLDRNFGDGSDGDVVISSPTSLTSDMYYDDLTVNDVITTNGYKIFVNGTLSGTGTIKYPAGNAGAAGSNNSGDSGGAGGAGGTAYTAGGVLRNTAGGAGGNGGNEGGGGNAGTAGGDGNIGVAGSAGGAGGQGGAAGGASGASISLSSFGKERWNTISLIDYVSGGTLLLRKPRGSGGGGGGLSNTSGGGATHGGGGGGGAGASGGIIFIMARTWAGTFTLEAVGGAGGAGGLATEEGAGGGGAGGSGGTVIVIYGTKTWSGSYTLTGGAAGAGGATAQAGTNGTAGLTGTYYEIDIDSLT